MKYKKLINIGMMGVVIGLAVASLALAVTISPNLPGPLNTTPSGTSPGAYIKNFYSYALFLSGLLAFGAIVYGGIKYAIARGNPSGESEAKQWIWSALLGMLLLAGAYLILFTINPNLVNLALPSLPAISNSNSTPPLTPAQEQQIRNIQQHPCNDVCPGQCQPDNTCRTIIINPNATLH